MKKLNLDDLDVSSFEIEATAALSSPFDQIGLTTIRDPTAATRCFVCPPVTYDFACTQQPY